MQLGQGTPEERQAPAPGAPQRRCIASGAIGPTEAMLRFVADPDGCVVPDLAEKLPGRGAWVAARRDCLERAVKRRLFNRALGGPVAAPADLAAQVEAALERRILELIGLCSRAGQAVWGFEKVRAVLAAGEAAVLIQAADASLDGRGKLARLARAVDPELAILDLSGAVALGRALGREQVVHLALRPGRLAAGVVREAARLNGLAPRPSDGPGADGAMAQGVDAQGEDAQGEDAPGAVAQGAGAGGVGEKPARGPERSKDTPVGVTTEIERDASRGGLGVRDDDDK